jgi:multiple sugar transport system ATP-binding protein
MATITLAGVEKRYHTGHVAVRGLDLDDRDGELLVLVGPSGSGKSTLLRLIAGLESPTAGRILIGGRDVTGLAPQERDLAMVFQSYALYPHLSVRENMGFGLRLRRTPATELARRVDDVAASLGLADLLDRKPAQLSGGQRQRVALGRAIAREPLAFLLDEPLSNLDAQLRAATRVELSRLHRRLGATMVYVTHDQVEAMTLGDRVAVLDHGVLQQLGSPDEIYRRPANRFVASFMGSPSMNFIEGRIEEQGGVRRFVAPDLALPITAPAPATGSPVVLGIRPHDVVVTGNEAHLRLPVTVIEPLGHEQIVHCRRADGTEIVVVMPGSARVGAGDVLPLRIPAEAIHLFDATS